MNWNKLELGLERMSIDELRKVNSYVVSLIKERKSELVDDMKEFLKPGMTVTVSKPGAWFNGKKFVVKKVNRSKALCSYGGANYNVPISMISEFK